MPLVGSLDVGPLEDGAPETGDLGATEPLTLEQVQVLQVMAEIDSAPMEAVLPPALHPTIPPTVTFVVWQAPTSPWGAFCLAQARVGARAGVRPRGYVLSCVIDNAAAADALASLWGFPCRVGEARLDRFHERVIGRASVDGAEILSVEGVDPEAVSGADVQYTANMHLARTPAGLRLVQVDPEYTFHRAERARPRVVTFDAGAWGDGRVRPVYPVSSTITVVDLLLPKLRYVCKPDVAAMAGTESIG